MDSQIQCSKNHGEGDSGHRPRRRAALIQTHQENLKASAPSRISVHRVDSVKGRIANNLLNIGR